MEKTVFLILAFMLCACLYAETGKLPRIKCNDKQLLKRRIAIANARVIQIVEANKEKGAPDAVISDKYNYTTERREQIIIEDVDLNYVANDELIYNGTINGFKCVYVWRIGTRKLKNRYGDTVILKRYTISPKVAKEYYTKKKR